ncbi:MAG TPA: hypothetical protein VGK25_13730 [Ignavibacteria bacterium]
MVTKELIRQLIKDKQSLDQEITILERKREALITTISMYLDRNKEFAREFGTKKIKSFTFDNKKKLKISTAITNILLNNDGQPMTAVEIKEELEKYIKEGRVTTKNKSLYNVVHSVLKPFTRTEKVIRYNKEGVPMYKLNESYKLNDFNE